MPIHASFGLRVLIICLLTILSAMAYTVRPTSGELVTLFGPSVDIHTSSGYTRSNPRELTANYTYLITASGTSFDISMHTLQTFAYSNVTGVNIIVNPTKPFTYSTTVDDLGNDVLTVRLNSQTHLGSFSLTVLQHVTVYSISYNVDPQKAGQYDKSSELYRLYTKSAEYIESDSPEIMSKSKEIVAGETNPYLAAQKIQNYVVGHLTYDMSAVTPWKPETEGALFALGSGKGVCRHYAALFTALARAAGIPTVDIWGSRATSEGVFADAGDQKHNWVHFFVPNYGWIPAEPTLENAGGIGWFAKLRDNGDVPIMSVNYVYERAWWHGGTAEAVTSSEEPNIVRGYQVAEFPNVATMLLALLIAAPFIFRIRRKRQVDFT